MVEERNEESRRQRILGAIVQEFQRQSNQGVQYFDGEPSGMATLDGDFDLEELARAVADVT
jgi:hypothetical protein